MPEQNSPSPNQPPAPQPSLPPDLAASYVRLVRFLVCPFLDSPDLLRVDCEISPRTLRVLIRLAFEGDDKGRVFGRGGRNLQAVRTVIQAVAQASGHSAHLEVFGSQPGQSVSQSGQQSGHQSGQRPDRDEERSSRPALPRPVPQPRLNQ